MISKIVRKLFPKKKIDFVQSLREKGMRIGERTVIYDSKSVVIDQTRPWMIEIGNDVKITHGVVILTHGFDWSVMKGVYGDILGSCGKVTIGNNVFIGTNAIILKGVTVGNNVIIGAGSVVNRDIPDNCVAVGNPAKVVMTLEEYHQKRMKLQEQEAKELVREYRKVYGKNPGEQEMSEFFWLFTDSGEQLPERWEFHMGLGGNRELSESVLRQHPKVYQDMEDFFRSC